MCTKKTHGELNFCRVPAICRGLCLVAHGKMCVCRVPDLCRVPDVSPTANFVAHGKGTFSGSESDWAVVWLPNLQQYVAIFIHWAASPRAAPVGAWPCTNGLHPGAGPQHSFFKKNNKINKYTLFRTKSNHNASHLLSSKDRRDLNFFSFIALLNRLLKWVLFFAFGGNGKIISFLLGNAGIVPGFFLKL